MRLVHTFDRQSSASTASTGIESGEDHAGDALAAACLFGIVGGLLFGLAVVPTVSAILVGATLGAGLGVIIAYH